MASKVLSGILGYFSPDLAVDMGTANTRVYVQGKGLVCREPSVVAVHHPRDGGRRLIAAGDEAQAMVGRTPVDIEALRPLRDGVISDFELAEAMLRHFIGMATGSHAVVSPRVVVCVPYNTTDVEQRALREAAEAAGAREVHLLDASLAAAIGADLPIFEPRGQMLVDLGAGSTVVAVISMGEVVSSRSLDVGGDALDEAITRYMRRERELLIGAPTAERIKLALGSAAPGAPEDELIVRGRSLSTGYPRAETVGAAQIREALDETVGRVVDSVMKALDRTAPEISADILDQGIVLTGGGALLGNMDRRLRRRTGLPVVVADAPIDAAVRGAGQALEQPRLLPEIAR